MAERNDTSSDRKVEGLISAVDQNGILWEWDEEFTGCKTLEEIMDWIKNGQTEK